jgi:hypothetical protein
VASDNPFRRPDAGCTGSVAELTAVPPRIPPLKSSDSRRRLPPTAAQLRPNNLTDATFLFVPTGAFGGAVIALSLPPIYLSHSSTDVEGAA